MILNHKDISLSKNYTREFGRLIHFYLPYTRKYYVNLYIPNIIKQTDNNTNQERKNYYDTSLISLQDILQQNNPDNIIQGATYNIYDKAETGIKYTKIVNFPIWFIDTSVAQTQLNINDIHAGYIQEFMATMLKFPSQHCNNNKKVIDTFVQAVIEFDESKRYFTINSETKYSAFGEIIDTLYQCNCSVLKQKFDPDIDKILYYSDIKHELLTEDLSNIYKTVLNKLNTYYNKHKYDKNYIAGFISDSVYFIDIIFILNMFNIFDRIHEFKLDFPHFINLLYQANINNYTLPQNINDYITTMLNNLGSCNTIILDNNIDITIYVYNYNNKLLFSLYNNLSNANLINTINIANFNLHNTYNTYTPEYWQQFTLLLLILYS